MRQSIPNVMFVLVPIFAGLVALVFRSRRMRYPQHLAFALHTHAFLFLALIPTLAPRVTRNAVVDALAVISSFGAIAVYMVLAMRRVYGGSLRGAILRSGAVGSDLLRRVHGGDAADLRARRAAALRTRTVSPPARS